MESTLLLTDSSSSFAREHKNWAETITYSTSKIVQPKSVEEIQAILRDPSIKYVKTQGTGHTFNLIADSYKQGVIISLVNFKDVTVEDKVVHFGAGITYSELIRHVDKAGKALANLPSLPHINVVGSMITATHGSGHKQPLLVAHVQSYDIVLPNGDFKIMTRDDPHFFYYIHSFGCLGVITRMSMSVEPTFNCFKAIYEDLDWSIFDKQETTDQVFKSSEFLSLFTDWKTRKMSSVWVAHKYHDEKDCPKYAPNYFEAEHIKTLNVHPVRGRDSTPCVFVGSGSWKEKIYHFFPDAPPSSGGDESHTEYFIPYKNFKQALEALYAIREHFIHLVQVSELRFVAADNIPMSPAKGQDVVGFHWTWFRKHDEILKVLPLIEKTLAPFNPKPHFGKLFILDGPTFLQRFGQDLVTLRDLVVKHDPHGKFSNEYSTKYLNLTYPINSKTTERPKL